jgi:hypothetical protein
LSDGRQLSLASSSRGNNRGLPNKGLSDECPSSAMLPEMLQPEMKPDPWMEPNSGPSEMEPGPEKTPEMEPDKKRTGMVLEPGQEIVPEEPRPEMEPKPEPSTRGRPRETGQNMCAGGRLPVVQWKLLQ